ncbi:MAG: putative S-layer protein [Nanoarchaeota archaeon]
MKQKTFSLMALTILSLVMLVGFASAAVLTISNTSTIPSTATQGQVITIPINLTHDGTDVNFTLNWSVSDSEWTTLPSISSINVSETKTGSAILTIPSSAPLGTYNSELKVRANRVSDGTYYATYSLPVSLTITSSSSSTDIPEDISECALTGTTGNLKIEIDDINNVAGFGDDNEWLPLDKIEVDIKVENDGDEKIKNIEVKWGLYDVDNNNWVFDEKESDFNLKDGDDKTITVTFDLSDPSDYEDGNNFVFYVWATAEDSDFDDREICVSDSDEIEIIIESDFVVVGDLEYLDIASCGDSVPISAKIWNIGDSDQDEVSVVIYNKELKFSQTVEVGDINAFDSESFDMILELPQGMDEKLYQFKMEVRDEDGDVYINDYDDDEAVFTLPIIIEGCGVVAQTASVSANLESGGKAGSPLVIRATITNTADKSVTYTLNAAGYTEWASSATIDQKTFTINAGNSKDVLITFDVNKDAEGTKFFDIEIISDNELVLKQPVSVSIEKSGFSLTDGNTYVWLLGILIVVLLIAIIIVAVRLGRR